MKIISDEKLLPLGIISGTTTKALGNMRELENQERLFDALALPKANFLRLKQVHGDKVLAVASDADFNKYKNAFEEADAWVLTRPGTGVIILTADCAPVFMWSADGEVLGLAHAGWRGACAQLPAKLAKEMQKLTDKDILVSTGPHIQKCCFEVQDDVAQVFPGCVTERDGKKFVDLRLELERQLLGAGIKQENITLSGGGCGKCGCTCCSEQTFYSYRRTGQRDAIMSFMYKV